MNYEDQYNKMNISYSRMVDESAAMNVSLLRYRKAGFFARLKYLFTGDL